MPGHSADPWYAWTGVSHVLILDAENAADDGDNRPIAKLSINDYPNVEAAEADANRIVACVNACRGLNPEHVPELVAMVERVAQLLLFDTFEDAADRENIQRQCGTDALALLAKVKQ